MASRVVSSLPIQIARLSPHVIRVASQYQWPPECLPTYNEAQSAALSEIMAIINDPSNQLPPPPSYEDVKQIHDAASAADNARFFNSALDLLRDAWDRLTFSAIWQIIQQIGKIIAVSATLALGAYVFYCLGMDWVSSGLKVLRLDNLGKQCLGMLGKSLPYLTTLFGYQPPTHLLR